MRFCPVLFATEPAPAAGAAGEAQPAAAATAGGLPYRLVLAVATMDSIVRPAAQCLRGVPGWHGMARYVHCAALS